MKRGAIMAFPDRFGEYTARLMLERDIAPGKHAGVAAWLMCNPSMADALQDDPTAGRVVHHSARNGRARALIGNVWCFRTPYPSVLWNWLDQNTERYRLMHRANLDALAMIGAQADIHIVAFGAEPMRRHPGIVTETLEAFSLGGSKPLYCLGTTADNCPLHPLARGKHAVRNDAELQPWRP